jgi:hypothetical protein
VTAPATTPISSEQSKPPRVLLLATERWLTTARLALALHTAGCEVQLMALARHPAMLTGAVNERYAYRPLNPITSVTSAIEQAMPDTVVPVDELAVMHVIELLESPQGKVFTGLAERSLGGADVFSAAISRITLLKLAHTEGIAIPETLLIDSPDQLPAAGAQLGFPLVLKADSTAGGRGVRVANNVEEAREWWRRLHRPLSLPRSLWRMLKWKEWTHFRPWFKRRMRGVTAQRYQRGGERTAMAVAHKGKLEAHVCFEVAQTSKYLGPSTVLRVVEDPAMVAAMRAVLRRLGATGFCGFDFMLSDTGEPLLIEMNSRPTQLAHLALGPGKDLVAAYVRSVLGHDVADRDSAAQSSLIAMYPQELVRDPQSAVLAEAHHDVPWESPALMRYALEPLPVAITNDPRWQESKSE